MYPCIFLTWSYNHIDTYSYQAYTFCILLLCVCAYAYMHMYVWMCCPMWACVEARSSLQNVFLNHFSTVFSETRSLTTPGAHYFSCAGWPALPWDLPVSTHFTHYSQNWAYKRTLPHLVFMCTMDSNSGSHPCGLCQFSYLLPWPLLSLLKYTSNIHQIYTDELL